MDKTYLRGLSMEEAHGPDKADVDWSIESFNYVDKSVVD